jgi:DNA-3-methyladenine glycosylase II
VSAPAWWAQACLALARADPVLGGLIVRFDGESLASRGEPFETLLRAIVGQQISVAAADAVWGRLREVTDVAQPRALLAAAPDALRAAGLSVRKVDYAGDLARHFVDGRLDPARFATLDDAGVVAELTAVRGIGRWSAEMFLLFNLMRPDVWPVDDIGLQKAVAARYDAGVRPDRRRLDELGERLRPWRSAASWLLWRSIDPVDVKY